MVARSVPTIKIAETLSEIYKDHKFTKNAVIGICHRNNIEFPKGNRKKKTAMRKHRRIDAYLRANAKPTERDYFAPFSVIRGTEVEILKSTRNDCAFPIDTPKGVMFCGCVAKKRSYCYKHYKLCHTEIESPKTL